MARTKRGKRIKQINNLTIYYSNLYGKYHVYTPDGRCWEEFDTIMQAEIFCQETKDFVRR